MVDAVVSFVVDRLGDLLIEQVVFLRGVKDDVEWLRDKLEYMLCFLKDAEEKQDVDNRMRKWIYDIRDVAYEAEDIIDNFILKVEADQTPKKMEVETPKKMGLKDCFQKYFCICSKHASLIQQGNLYGIGQEINTLKTKLTQIQQNQVTFGIRSIDDAREGSNRINTEDSWLRRERPYKDNEHVVGFKEDVDKLTSQLVKKVKDRYVISIVGTEGLGKTTIARKLYNTLSLTKVFDCYAWVSVSTDYRIQDLLRSTIKSFTKPNNKEELEFLEKMKEEDLEPHLRETLKGHRYLVVLDDVWDVNAWRSLSRAFPDEKIGSRVIMTTRNKVVAEPSDERTYVHELPFLKEKENWELFCSKAFPNYDEWKLPTEVLPNFRYLYIEAWGFSEDPMPVLKKLPKLTILLLFGINCAKMVCTAGGFPQLEILQLRISHAGHSPSSIQVEGGGMPLLMGLLIEGYGGVRMPDRLRSIPRPDPPLDWGEWAY
ncbi:hypothetical protein RHMOL_Rhmol09G0006000 [Rhododendron molle]|uniref:Uncharacterized protein n=1 Tax=Rhododendron molle TaxID=49168 RepID=A0ACC0M9M1_RHOML|nr:hypothetical protein RHMOL_Rhmol09G0006000 [Rhododendron molle]